MQSLYSLWDRLDTTFLEKQITKKIKRDQVMEIVKFGESKSHLFVQNT